MYVCIRDGSLMHTYMYVYPKYTPFDLKVFTRQTSEKCVIERMVTGFFTGLNDGFLYARKKKLVWVEFVLYNNMSIHIHSIPSGRKYWQEVKFGRLVVLEANCQNKIQQ